MSVLLYYIIKSNAGQKKNMTKKESLERKANALSSISNDYGRYITTDTAREFIHQVYLIERLHYQDFYFNNDERLYSPKESERREKRFEKRFNALQAKLNACGLRMAFYGLPAHIEIQGQKGSWHKTNCAL